MCSLSVVGAAVGAIGGPGEGGAGAEDLVGAAVNLHEFGVEVELVGFNALLEPAEGVGGLGVEGEVAAEVEGAPEAAAVAEAFCGALEGGEEQGAESAFVEDGDADDPGAGLGGRGGRWWKVSLPVRNTNLSGNLFPRHLAAPWRRVDTPTYLSIADNTSGVKALGQDFFWGGGVRRWGCGGWGVVY